ncbi:hypothetical protein DL768_005940 [Monosporascus sp. mg162]|nr:hypothetical protein DL768_005940 [Monosporascus sp. mg162]
MKLLAALLFIAIAVVPVLARHAECIDRTPGEAFCAWKVGNDVYSCDESGNLKTEKRCDGQLDGIYDKFNNYCSRLSESEFGCAGAESDEAREEVRGNKY